MTKQGHLKLIPQIVRTDCVLLVHRCPITRFLEPVEVVTSNDFRVSLYIHGTVLYVQVQGAPCRMCDTRRRQMLTLVNVTVNGSGFQAAAACEAFTTWINEDHICWQLWVHWNTTLLNDLQRGFLDLDLSKGSLSWRPWGRRWAAVRGPVRHVHTCSRRNSARLTATDGHRVRSGWNRQHAQPTCGRHHYRPRLITPI